MKKLYIYLLVLLCIAQTMHSYILDKPGTYELKRANDAINLLHIDLDNNQHVTRLFNLQDISISGAATNQDTIERTFFISADYVTFNLSGFNITGGISIDEGKQNITILNGLIDGLITFTDITQGLESNFTTTDVGIRVNENCRDIYLNNLTIRNAVKGIEYNQVSGGAIRYCDLMFNTTGVELNQSCNIVIEYCTATANTNSGFCLLQSTTNCLRDCKALSIGEGNDEILNQTIIGFVSAHGGSNIFERCIANSTQALSTTDQQSLIAGFALRGSESCSKIIECESANATTDPTGVTVPYGIVLEGSLDNLVAVTSAQPNIIYYQGVRNAEWSPDGKYLAVGSSDAPSNGLAVYRFDRVSASLTRLFSADYDVEAVAWSSDGKYLTVGGQIAQGLLQYAFDTQNESFSLIQTINIDGGGTNDIIHDISWSSDNQYVVVGGSIFGDTNNDVFVLRFDSITELLTAVASVNPVSGTGDTVFATRWSPDNQYLAVGGILNGTTGEDLIVYRFDRDSETLTEVDKINPRGSGDYDSVYGISWSPDGKYLAIGGLLFGSGGSGNIGALIYEWNKQAEQLSFINGVNPEGGTGQETVYAVNWSPDGKYLAVGGALYMTTNIFIYLFDRGSGTFTEIASADPGGSDMYGDTNTLTWSPDGAYLASGGFYTNGSNEDDLFVYSAIDFPSKNVIKNNTVYCNSGGIDPQGVGISGSSIANMIIGNTAYSNPIPQLPNHLIVGSNYQFVTNVFNPLFQNAPTLLQNISVDGCTPICMPDDQIILAKQIRYKICELESQEDVITDFIDGLIGAALCNATAITAGTTINSSGIYCVDQSITGTISITADNVVLDLSNYVITGLIQASGQDCITVKNGVVDASMGEINSLLFNQNCSNITLENITVKNAVEGINFSTVQKGLIKNCVATNNITGIGLYSSHSIVIDSCQTLCNSQDGIELWQTSTCCVRDCKILDTGSLDTVTVDLFGIVSQDGYGNIIERCIVNSTQGLTTSYSQAQVSGIALEGLEECTKVIDSESGNSAAAVGGLSTAYGLVSYDGIDAYTIQNQVASGSAAGNGIRGMAWSPDGVYLFYNRYNDASQSNTDVRRFTPPSTLSAALNTLTAPVGRTFGVEIDVNDEDYVAITYSNEMGTDGTLQVVKFNRGTETFGTPLNENIGGDFREWGCRWSPDGTLIAVTSREGKFVVYSFDKDANTLTSASDTFNHGGFLIVGAWSVDQQYLAIGGQAGTGGAAMRVLRFDRDTGSLTEIVASRLSGIGVVHDIWFSPDGKYVAASTGTGSLSPAVRVYRFKDGVVNQVAFQDGILPGAATQVKIILNWSACTNYLALVGEGSGGDTANLYEFDRATNELFVVDSNTTASQSQAVSWGMCQFIAIGFANTSVGIYDLGDITYPTRNVITNNTVYCTSGGAQAIGISGNDVDNLIIQNVVYNNPINLQFGSNVDQIISSIDNPSLLTNIAVVGCEPIVIPTDPVLLAMQINATLDSAKVLTASDVFDRMISLTESGCYCVSQDLTTDISITTTCVYLDLNHHCLTGIISVATADDVIITNGTITPPAPSATPTAAITIASTVNRAQINLVNIVCAASTGNGIRGRDAIEVIGNNVQINDCTLVAGAASDRTTAGVGVRGGHGVLLSADATKPIINNCTITSGDGGAANGAANNGGDAGDAVSVASGCVNAQINDNIIFVTGTGGNGGASAIGGRGGNGVSIASGAVDTQVINNRFRNTGAGGSGATAGVGGKAVDDDVTTLVNLSQVFKNFAHNIASATKFDLQASGFENGVLTPNPPTSAVINPFANVFT